ncbi:cell envelope biogenesis protein TonB (plasmid) [Fulvitalea axinellae]|uniref:Cell envelope biogenesis protein TonB n=1 Tax=Fulvitalea axinellae TaxID=1182444 RepID=A0AAU9CJ20_9BACT|nr:cell envelope biogenesis protein TonB [Fulvitalea axinellae]
MGHLANAQVEGVVLDYESNTPLVGAIVRSGKEYTATQPNGTFLINVQVGDSLEIKYLGYRTYHSIIKDRHVRVTLRTKSEVLDAVGVVALSVSEEEAKRIRSSITPVTVITSKELLTKAGNLNEILARQAGIQIRQTGGLGSVARINIRGLEGKRVQLFVNGNPLNTPDGSLGINDIPIQVIERIEVYKGSVPAWLGGDGLGSAVNIVVRDREVSYVDVNLVRQSFNTSRAGLILKKSFDKRGIEAGLGVFNTYSDNDYEMSVPDQENLKVVRDHDRFHSLLIGGGVKFSKLWFDEVEFEGAFMKTEKQIQGITRNIQKAESQGETLVGIMNLKKTGLLGGRLSMLYSLIRGKINVALIDTSSYSYNWDGTRTLSNYGKGELGIGPNMSDTEQSELRHRLNLNYSIDNTSSLNFNNTIRSSDFDPRDDLANEFAGKNLFNYPGRLFNTVSGLTLEKENKRKNFLLSAAVKYYFNHTEGYNTNIYVQGSPERINTNTHNLGYLVGLRYNFSEYLLAKAVHERAVRLPNNSELFGDGVLITPSIKLQPEVAYNYTAGLVYDRFFQGYRRVQAEVNGFYMNVDNLIQLAGNGLSVGYVNYAKAYILGADLELKSDLTPWLYSGLNLTYQRIVDNNEFIPGTKGVDNPTYKEDIPNIPQMFANLNVELHKDNLLIKRSRSRLIYDLAFTQEYDYGFALSVYDKFVIPSFLTHTVSVEQSFKKDKYTVTFEANNLTDQLVINNYNQPLPGRTFRLKLRCLFLGRQTHHDNHNR